MSHLQHAQEFCQRCRVPTMHVRSVVPFNHTPHILATLLLCGLWAPVWLVLALTHKETRDAWRCTQCGASPYDLQALPPPTAQLPPGYPPSPPSLPRP